MAVKLWRMNDCDWVAAETMQEAKDTYLSACDHLDDPREVTEEEMDRLMFLDEPEHEDSPKRSFREQLAAMVARGEKFPDFFATSEY